VEYHSRLVSLKMKETERKMMKQGSAKRERIVKAGILLMAVLFLHGCSVKHPVQWPGGPEPAPSPAPRPRPTPAPTPAPAPVPAPVPESVPESVPNSAPISSRESVPAPQEGKAAGALLASARQQVRAGDFSQAEIILERALRVEPRNARLWHEMAQVKYAQQDYSQTVQFCIKSNSLAGRDYNLIQQNWLLMEKAYINLGEPEKARQARVKSG
jgi:tetratricopeptide (TPR) repeat protein